MHNIIQAYPVWDKMVMMMHMQILNHSFCAAIDAN